MPNEFVKNCFDVRNLHFHYKISNEFQNLEFYFSSTVSWTGLDEVDFESCRDNASYQLKRPKIIVQRNLDSRAKIRKRNFVSEIII